MTKSKGPGDPAEEAVIAAVAREMKLPRLTASVRSDLAALKKRRTPKKQSPRS
jgi:hypothetical protein